MSTRCTIHFNDSNIIHAIIYRHWDGSPKDVLPDIAKFLNVCSQLEDTRLDDPSYLAAKFVVWQAHEYNTSQNLVDFLGVGICQQDPLNIDYVYTIDCSTYPPTITSNKKEFNHEN